MDAIPGRATPEGTLRFANRHRAKYDAKSAYLEAPSSKYTVSALGFGCYRVDNDIPEHRSSLELAIKSGINLIDTSTNYSDGNSETAVGKVLAQLISRGEIARDEVVVVSKVGYVQGTNLDLAQTRETTARPFPEMVKYMDGCWHCLHPDFLKDQLERSRDRLGLGTVDVYLLHNPEYFLADALKRRALKQLDVGVIEEFYRRIYEAFLFLEREAQTGRIVYYGVSSNTMGGDPTRSDTTSLKRFQDAAVRAAKTAGNATTRFQFIQVPLNLYELGPALQKREDLDGSTTLAAARGMGLGVLLNRPLNALTGGRLIRLADFPVAGTESVTHCLQRLKNLETQFDTQLAAVVPKSATGVSPGDMLKWGEHLERIDLDNLEVDYIRQVAEQIIFPRTDYAIQQIDTGLDPVHIVAWRTWKSEYESALQAAIRSLYAVCAKRAQATSDQIRTAVIPLLPKGLEATPLSQLALATLMGFSGVTCVLNGMRRQEYVEDSLGAMKLKNLGLKAKDVAKALQRD